MTVWLPCIATGTGAEVWTRRLAEGLAARGWRVQLDLVPHIYQYAPWAARLRPPADCVATVANSWSAAAFVNRSPLVTVVHHVVHERAFARHRTPAQAAFHTAFVRPMEMAAIARAERVIAVSQATRRAVEAEFGHREASTVLNGIDIDRFVPGRRPENRGRLELLFVGKPSRRKGFDLIAQLAAHLGDRARLTVVGSDPERGLPCPQARWLGRVSDGDIVRAYQQADFLLLPSHVEGFGYAAAEAMACGTPVVCAPKGAVAEIARPGEAAVAGTDPAKLANELLTIKADTARYEAMRSAARRIAERDLDQSRWLDEMERMLRGVTNKVAVNHILRASAQG